MRLQANTSKISQAYFSLPDPKLQNFHQNNSCKVTKSQKTKLHIYLKTTIGLSSRQCIYTLYPHNAYLFKNNNWSIFETMHLQFS